MSNQSKSNYLLCCNGAGPEPSKLSGRGRRSIERLDLATYGAGKNVVLKMLDITDRMGERLPDVIVDLLELAVLVYAADQCCKRTPGRRFEYGRRWHRSLRFEVAVRRPDFWCRPEVIDALGETLDFLSEDDYEFAFHPAHEPPRLPEYLEYGPGAIKPEPIKQVMLMSGGLDSLAGAAQQVLQEQRRVAMVSHKPVDHMGTRQRGLVRSVGDRSGRAKLRPFHVPVTAHKLGLTGEDFTQRTRSFLYASIGAAVADLFKLSDVWFYENGVTSVNLPLCAQEVGGRATRTTHPQALHGFGRILSLVFDRPFGVHNGLFWHTKQDVLELLRRHGQADLAAVAVSCSHTRQITNPSPHCGLCSQCLARRVAALGAEYAQDDPSTGYREDPLTGRRDRDEERILAERFVGQARDVARMTAVAQFTRRYAGELSRVYPYVNMPTTVAAERLFDLHLRHAEQVSAAVVRQIGVHAEDYWRGRMCDTCALAYAFGLAKPAKAARVDLGAANAGGVEGGGVRLDEETFTVSTDEGSYKFGRRSGQPFALLARLARRRGYRVWFDQLRETGDVWGGRTVEDVTIRGAATRLKEQLVQAGLPSLGEAIRTGTYQGRGFIVLDAISEVAVAS